MYRDEEDQVRPPLSRSGGAAGHLRQRSATVVLVVEDDAPLRRVLAETLEIYGYEVVAAASTEAAVEELDSERITVVVIDHYLLGNGHTVLTARITEAGVPVILISASSRPTAGRRAEELGASRFLVKPVTGQELHDAIEEVRPRPGETRG